jgi:diaminohydroxyphosphoribosylaminopyrimidine deaminase/5-amino-6-(5-phosphoribosylamino)uracil reductase
MGLGGTFLDAEYIRLGLRLARRGFGATSPNPMVGAVLTKGDKIIGRGWHRRAGQPHAEIEALRDAERRGHHTRNTTLYVTLEPCCTHGRTPPCTAAIIAAGVRRVVVGATDPNPRHAGRGFKILRRAGIRLEHGVLAEECEQLNESFNHWIRHHEPFVIVKAAMTLDGKIATPTGESKWITSEASRAYAMKLREGADAVLVGINTILADNPSLTIRSTAGARTTRTKQLRRIVLDCQARTPVDAQVVSDELARLTTIVVSRHAPEKRKRALSSKAQVLIAPSREGRIDLRWLLKRLGSESVNSVLVEGGGEVNASFLLGGFARRVAFFYAPLVLGGADARKAVAGDGVKSLKSALTLSEVRWHRLDVDWLLTARVKRKV